MIHPFSALQVLQKEIDRKKEKPAPEIPAVIIGAGLKKNSRGQVGANQVHHSDRKSLLRDKNLSFGWHLRFRFKTL